MIKDLGKLATALALSTTAILPATARADHPETCADIPAFVSQLMGYEEMAKRVQYVHIQPFPKNIGNDYFKCLRDSIKKSGDKLEIKYAGEDRNNVYFRFTFRKPSQ